MLQMRRPQGACSTGSGLRKTMRLITQAAVLVVLVGAGAAGWYGWQNYGQTQAAAQQGPGPGGGGPGGGGPGGRGGGAAIPVEVITVKTGVVVERVESVGSVRANESITIAAKQ